jgi:predicted PurR-regulated permease PerM
MIYMAQDQDSNRIRNISLIILAILAVLYVILYFTLSLDISLAIIISSLLAFIVFIATLAYYRWISTRKMVKAARSVMISFIAKIIIFGAMFYLLVRLDY